MTLLQIQTQTQIPLQDLEYSPDNTIDKCVYYAGVDNGFTGATAIVRKVAYAWEVVEVFPYNRENPELLLDFYSKYKPMLSHVLLERPFLSFTRSSVSKTNYEIFGRYLQTLDILGIKHVAVMPKQWQAHLKIAKTATSSTKEQSIDFVRNNTISGTLSIRQPAYSSRKLGNQKWADKVHFNDNWADSICLAISAEAFNEEQ